MTTDHRRVLGVLAAGVVLAGGLAACGSADDSPGGSPGDAGVPPHDNRRSFGFTTTGALSGTAYEGPAVVERSTEKELVLAFGLPAPNDGTSGAYPTHASITSLGGVTLPLGAQVYLNSEPLGPVQYGALGNMWQAWGFSVREGQGGRLLFGGSSGALAPDLVPLEKTGSGSRPYADECGRGTASYDSYAIGGDTTVALTDGQRATVAVGGVDYDVDVNSWSADITTYGGCADYGPPSMHSIAVMARDLAPLTAALPAGPSFACARGNAQLPDIAVTMYGVVTFGTGYDGPAVYTKSRLDGGNECLSFHVDVPAYAANVEAAFEACAPIGRLPKPAVGEQFWATTVSDSMASLRRTQGGPPLVARVGLRTPDDAAVAAFLGTSVTTARGCDYATVDVTSPDTTEPQPTVMGLWDVSLGGAAPIKSDAQGVLSLGGGDLHVWVTGSTSPELFYLVVLAR